VELINEFRVHVPIERAWAVLTDVERIAPCLPGAQLQEIEGEEYRGIVKVKVGPITAQYKGAATFVERDAPNRLVLRAEGRETRGQGNAAAVITVTLAADGDATNVGVHTDLTVTGKVAQFGARGVLAEVSTKLLGQFVESLEATVLAGEEQPTAADEPAADEPAATVPATDEHVTEPAAPAVRLVDHPEAAPVDLMGAAGAPVAKRLAPVAGVFALLWLLRLFLKRRKR
jgi:carbon monoxide dehydrogenase subunit G